MPRGLFLVFTSCTDPDREEEFNRWYTHTHLPDLSAARGFVRARRFKNVSSEPGAARYLAVYEFDNEDLADSMRDLLRLAMQTFADGRHIDCIEGGLPNAGPPALLFEEIDSATLEPLDRVDYPRRVPQAIQTTVARLLDG